MALTVINGPSIGIVPSHPFPATQIASSDVNTLDDYEEGTWTPIIGGGTSESGQTYGIQAGNYIKIGQLVWCAFDVATSTKGTIVGGLQLKGLPFTCMSGAGLESQGTVTIGYWAGTADNWYNWAGHVVTGDSAISLYAVNVATTATVAPVTANINNSFRLIGHAMYRASA